MFKIQPIRVAHQKREGLSNFEKSVFDFSVLYLKKSGLSKKLKVSTLDIRIKQLGLKVFHFKVPSFCKLFSQFAIFWCNSSNVSLLKITLKESIDYQEEVPVYTYLPGTLEKTILYLDPIHWSWFMSAYPQALLPQLLHRNQPRYYLVHVNHWFRLICEKSLIYLPPVQILNHRFKFKDLWGFR